MGRENEKGRNTMKKNNQLISRAARKYLILQLPGAGLFIISLILIRQWVDMPAWLFWGLIVLWVAKDVAMFPFVRKAYEPQDDANPMIGSLGVVEKRLSPSGFVRIRGELWKAHVPNGSMPIDRGETMRVIAVEGLTLVVERAAERPGQEQ
jgi:membrane protein implicated in regulation of membrane protease activity